MKENTIKAEDKEPLQREKSEAIEEVKESLFEDLQRVQAEFENYIKRVEKDKEREKIHVKSELLLKLINIKEDLEKALENIEDDGIKMIYNNVKKILEEEGVKEIKSLGGKFNHNLHEAVKKVESEEEKIVEEVQKGYLLENKILRISKVVIGGKDE